MPDWNPSSTGTKGLEWPAGLLSAVTLDATAKAGIARVPSLVGEQLGLVYVFIRAVIAPGGAYELEIYEAGSEIPGASTLSSYLPDEDVTLVNIQGVPTDTAGNRYTNINEAVGSEDEADYIQGTDDNWSYDGRVNIAGGALTGRRVLSVTLKFYGRATGSPPVTTGSGLVIDGVLYGPETADAHNLGALPNLAESDPSTLQYATWYRNPATGLPWHIDEVEEFGTVDEYRLSLVFPQPNPVGTAIFTQAWMEVVHVVENRKARGFAIINTAGWNAIAVSLPTAGLFTKNIGTTYSYLLRRLTRTGSVQWITLDSGFVSPIDHVSYTVPVLNADGSVRSLGAQYTAVFPIVIETSGAVISGDSQPYATATSAAIFSGQNAEQEFSNAATASYEVVRVLLTYAVQTAAAPLLLKVKRRSDNVQLGSTVTITAAEVAALTVRGGGWKLYEGRLGTPASLSAGVQYYFEFSSTVDGDDEPGGDGIWSVCVGDTQAFAEAQSFGGTTDAATINGGAEDTQYDLMVTIATIPTAPAGFAAARLEQTLEGDLPGCAVTVHAYGRLTWTATALGAAFDRYEIERSDDGGSTWELVQEIATEATVAWPDYEARRRIATSWRIRVVRGDLAFSAWSTSLALTLDPQGAAWVFVSNEDPTLNVGYQIFPERSYDFLSATEVVTYPIFGRDYQIALQPTEERGVAFDLALTVSMKAAPPYGGRPGVAVFDKLRAIATDPDISYVCVLDPDGNRFLAKLRVPRGTHHEPGHIYTTVVNVTEITDEPSTGTA